MIVFAKWLMRTGAGDETGVFSHWEPVMWGIAGLNYARPAGNRLAEVVIDPWPMKILSLKLILHGFC